jgi:hypothetical protein
MANPPRLPDTVTARRRLFVAVAAVAAVLAVAAVAGVLALSGGGDEGDGVASAGGEQNAAKPAATVETAPLDADAQALVFAGCVRDNGVDMPDPGPGRQGLVDAFQAVSADYDRATLQQAFAACEDLMPQYPQEQEMHEGADMLDLAECLREQGLDVSDNPFQDAHSGAIDVNEFSAAMEVCRDVLTGGGP